jgi:predicted N-acyltransferase
LFCGIPISVGKNSLTISSSIYLKEILHALVVQMELIAIQNEIGYICFKEFRADEVNWLDTLTESGFMKIESLPYVYMRINWLSFDKYLGAMRHNYRRQIIQSLFNKTLKQPIIQNYDPSVVLSESNEKLFLFNPSQFDPKKFFGLYMQIMNRIDTKLETLNEDFFINTFKLLEKQSLILAAVQNNEIKGAAYLIIDSNKITFLLVGLDYGYNNHHNVLMNLLYGIVKLAIDMKFKMLELGQTSYELKQRIGGRCIKEYFFLKSSNKKINFILKMLKPILFPVVEIESRRVFNM